MILTEGRFFSIQFFNSTGIEVVSDLTGLSYDEIEYEQDQGNVFISQAKNGRYFLFCSTDEQDKEITFNEFKRLSL
ncbi:hypothetical protein G1K66_08465 [Tenacibaculum finnmarkense]|uniref:hypothetical protein n=1 Tax=Tenacibaculum finnmarkense TaxID=2781243 RepID=UPI001EFBC825|nr:hypothetical protein [Tenacibaculum finnmarkense]MCG8813293.1 hypothetical protein [Tenacibaculum finnmarkense]